jgi:integrase
MSKSLLKAKAVENASVGSGEKLLSDGECLFLRVRPESKTWMFICRVPGGRRKLSLGQYPTVTLASARNMADELRRQVAEGIDPKEERHRLAVEKQADKVIKDSLPQTVKELFELWQRKELTHRKDGGRKDNGDESLRKFKKDVFPRIGALPLDAIRRSHILEIIDDVKARGAPRIAGIILSDLRQMFAFAIDREIMPTDPTAGLKKSKLGGNANERDRVLTETEIRQLASALPITLSESGQRAIWIMLGTCCRIGELTKARWEDIDFGAQTWRLPETKNDKPHTIFISGFVVEHLKALQALETAAAKKSEQKASEWVMPARHHSGCVCPKSLAKQISDRQRGSNKESMKRRSPLTDALILPGGKWTPHDLRRTGATLMVALGVRPDVVERCLNHSIENKVQRIYQRHSYAAEMQQAWQLLGERLQLLNANQSNVLTLNRSAEKTA